MGPPPAGPSADKWRMRSAYIADPQHLKRLIPTRDPRSAD